MKACQKHNHKSKEGRGRIFFFFKKKSHQTNMQYFFLSSWLVSAVHFTVWHTDTGMQGAQEGEGSLEGKRHPWLCSPGVGRGSGRSAGRTAAPGSAPKPPPSAPSVRGSPAVLPWQRRPRIFTPGRLLRSRCPNTREIWSQCGKLFSLGKWWDGSFQHSRKEGSGGFIMD